MFSIPFKKFSLKHELEINEIINNEIRNKNILKNIHKIARETYNLTYDEKRDLF